MQGLEDLNAAQILGCWGLPGPPQQCSEITRPAPSNAWGPRGTSSPTRVSHMPDPCVSSPSCQFFKSCQRGGADHPEHSSKEDPHAATKHQRFVGHVCRGCRRLV